MEKRHMFKTLWSKKSTRVVLCLFIPMFFVTILSFAKDDGQFFVNKEKNSGNDQVLEECVEEKVILDTAKEVEEVSKKEQENEVLEEQEEVKSDEMVVYSKQDDDAKIISNDDVVLQDEIYDCDNIKKNTVIIVRERQIDPKKPMVALTFDDGPNKIRTNKILDILEEHNAVATFFELGSLVERNKETVIREESLGCEVGNHSYEHKNLDKLSGCGIKKDIEKSERAFQNALGHKTKLFRAPYGNSNSKVRNNVDYPIIKWDIDTLDWKFRNKEKILNKIREVSNYDGRIILMHSLYDSTVDSVRIIVPELIEKGYQLVTVSELAYYKGYDTLENGKVFCNFIQRNENKD